MHVTFILCAHTVHFIFHVNLNLFHMGRRWAGVGGGGGGGAGVRVKALLHPRSRCYS